MHTDPIADMLTRIRNAVMARHSNVVIPASNMRVALARVLKDEGYIEDFHVSKDHPKSVIRIKLKYAEGKEPVITGLKRVSRPGRRIYTKRKNIPWVLNGMGVAIVSTSKGVMTGQQARRLGIGGEILCYVW